MTAVDKILQWIVPLNHVLQSHGHQVISAKFCSVGCHVTFDVPWRNVETMGVEHAEAFLTGLFWGLEIGNDQYRKEITHKFRTAFMDDPHGN